MFERIFHLYDRDVAEDPRWTQFSASTLVDETILAPKKIKSTWDLDGGLPLKHSMTL